MNNKKTLNAYIDLLCREGLADQVAVLNEANMTADVEYISYNSMDVKPGTLFICKGLNFRDEYLADAIEKGAVMYVAERKFDVEGVPYIIVNDMRRAMSEISAFYHDRIWNEGLQMIGITGTKGKSTTATFVKAIMDSYCQSLGKKEIGFLSGIYTYDGQRKVKAKKMTTPETLELHRHLAACVENGCEYLVMETSSHALHQGRIHGVWYDVGIFTNLTQDHLDYHKTMEAYCDAKAILFRNCTTGVVNADDGWTKRLMKDAACSVLTYAKEAAADLRAEEIELASDHIAFTAVMGEQRVPIRVNIPGGFMVYNTLDVLGAALALGISLEESAAVLSGVHHVKGRVEVVPTPGKDYTILIDYAHTPDALDNVLDSMRKVTDGRLVVLFGCGGDRDRTKRPIMGRIAQANADLVIVTSDNPRTEDPHEIIEEILKGMHEGLGPVQVIENRPEAIAWAIENHEDGDVIILAGKGHEDYQIIGTTKYHMDEREIVAEVLNKRRERK